MGDFEKRSDQDFIAVCADASIFEPALVKHLRQIKLLRNDCGHPTDIVTGEQEIMNALEFLINNVYAKYNS